MSKLSAVPGISSVHELHIWELVSGKVVATLHIKHQKGGDYREASAKVREIFHNAGIHNVTLQFEEVASQETLEQKESPFLCNSPCISKACAKQLCCPPGAPPLAHVNGCANGSFPVGVYREGSLGPRETTAVAVEVSWDGPVSDRGQAFTKTQEDQCYVNSTHF